MIRFKDKCKPNKIRAPMSKALNLVQNTNFVHKQKIVGKFSVFSYSMLVELEIHIVHKIHMYVMDKVLIYYISAT